MANLAAEPALLNGAVPFKPNDFGIHPGPKGEPIILRFTAPEPGKYVLNLRAQKMHSNAVTVSVVVNGRKKATGDTQRPFTFYDSMQLGKGSTVDIVFGLGTFGYNSNTTGFDVEMRPAT